MRTVSVEDDTRQADKSRKLKRPDDGACSELIKGFGPFTSPLNKGKCMNKYTVENILDCLNRTGDLSGLAFDRFGSRFANSQRLKAMKNHFDLILETDRLHIPDSTKKHIENWFDFLANRYGV